MSLHAVVRDIEELELLGRFLSDNPYGIDLELRTDIERSLFNVSKTVCRSAFDRELRSFSQDALEAIKTAALIGNQEEMLLLQLGFELRANLSLLASSDAYVSGELEYEFGGSRERAIADFGNRLLSFAARARGWSNASA